jgi:hypothetical protein
VIATSGQAQVAYDATGGGNDPVLVGEGKPAYPSDARIQLELLEERRFGNGVVNLRYRIQS